MPKMTTYACKDNKKLKAGQTKHRFFCHSLHVYCLNFTFSPTTNILPGE